VWFAVGVAARWVKHAGVRFAFSSVREGERVAVDGSRRFGLIRRRLGLRWGLAVLLEGKVGGG